jgi:peroxiredoxin 2/4
MEHATTNNTNRAMVGQLAPHFTADIARQSETMKDPLTSVSLSDYANRWLILFWYPLDFTFICPTEIIALSDRYEEFQELDCDILGASTDSAYSHRAWMQIPREKNGISGLQFPLLSDQTHQIARDYGVLIEDKGIALRGLFIIDPDGVLQYSTITNLNVGRSVDETLRVLQAIQSGGLCGSDWKPGMATL